MISFFSKVSHMHEIIYLFAFAEISLVKKYVCFAVRWGNRGMSLTHILDLKPDTRHGWATCGWGTIYPFLIVTHSAAARTKE